MIVGLFALLLGFSAIASIAFFATDSENWPNWIVLGLGLVYPLIAMRYVEFPADYTPKDTGFKGMAVYLLEASATTHILYLLAGLSIAAAWILHQEGTWGWLIKRAKGEDVENWD